MKPLSRILFSLLSAVILFSMSPVALAARSYLIELVVFTNLNTDNSESWASVHPPLSASKMSRVSMPGQGALEMKEIQKEIKESTFSYYVNRITKNPDRKVLLSTRWVQPVLGPGDTAIAHITDAKITDEEVIGKNQAIQANNAGSTPADNQIMLELPQLDGFVNFYLNHQYTLEADIRYTPPYRPSILDEEPDNGPVSYRIHEKRRMKSGELNYYDHPAFGMVLLVTPVATPPDQVIENN